MSGRSVVWWCGPNTYVYESSHEMRELGLHVAYGSRSVDCMLCSCVSARSVVPIGFAPKLEEKSGGDETRRLRAKIRRDGVSSRARRTDSRAG